MKASTLDCEIETNGYVYVQYLICYLSFEGTTLVTYLQVRTPVRVST